MNFKTFNGEEISLKEIVKLLDSEVRYDVYVGTDSHVVGDFVTFASCIVLHKKNKGARIFTWKEKIKAKYDLGKRLFDETMRSIQVSFELYQILPKNTEIIIHIDINSDKKHASAKYHDQLVGFVVGQGFKCCVKPQAAIAQSVADRFSK